MDRWTLITAGGGSDCKNGSASSDTVSEGHSISQSVNQSERFAALYAEMKAIYINVASFLLKQTNPPPPPHSERENFNSPPSISDDFQLQLE